MPTFSITESNSAPTSNVVGTLAPGTGTFSVLGVSLAGWSEHGAGQPLFGTYGTLVLNADGNFVYYLNNADPDTNALGTGMSALDRFTYTYTQNGVTSRQTVVFEVNGVDEPGQVVTSTATTIHGTNVTIGALDRITSTASPGVELDGMFTQGRTFTNDGALLVNSATAPSAAGFGFYDYGSTALITNNGLIQVAGPGDANGLGLGTAGPAVNYGVIRATSPGTAYTGSSSGIGRAIGIGSGGPNVSIENYGTVEALSTHGAAVGIWANHVASTITNAGLIYVSGGTANDPRSPIAGIQGNQSANYHIVNSGTIHAVSTEGSTTYGVHLFPDSVNDHQFAEVINSGTIVASIAVYAIQGYLTGVRVTNSGHIEGDLFFDHNLNSVTNTVGATWIGNLTFGDDEDMVVNAGTITGNIALGGGVGFYDGRGGSVDGLVYAAGPANILIGGNSADRLQGSIGTDRIEGGGGADTLTGNGGVNVFVYSSAADSTASAFDTITDFQTGVDKIDLGQLSPTSLSFSSAGGFTTVTALTPTGTLVIRAQGTVVASDILTAAQTGNLTGTSESDILAAITPNAELRGLGGDDVMMGSSGADLLDGGSGLDVMFGGLGDDTYVVNSSYDRIFEGLDGGTDTVLSWVDYSLPAYVENAVLLSDGPFNTPFVGLLGNDLDNVLVGNDGNNSFIGQGGDDVLYGKGGADTFNPGLGADIILYRSATDSTAARMDQINSFERGIDKIDVRELQVLSFSFTHGANYTLNLSWTDVAVETTTGTLVIRVGGPVDQTDFISNLHAVSGSAIGDTLLGSYRPDWLDGGLGDDTLVGGAGSDTLYGGAGDDRLFGGTGGDILVGGAGNDRFYFYTPPTEGTDRIADFDAGDLIYLESSTFGGLGIGALNAPNFREITEAPTYWVNASTPTPTILYLRATGQVFVDPDGNGPALAAVFAIINNKPAITASSFVVFDRVAEGVTVPSPAANDINGDGRGDLLVRDNASGWLGNWLGTYPGGLSNNVPSGLTLPNPGEPSTSVLFPSDWKVTGTGDYNGDGRSDMLLRSDAGWLTNWLGASNGGFVNNGSNVSLFFAPEWKVAGNGDFNGDGISDLLLRRDDGWLTNWLGTSTGSFANNGANTSLFFTTDWKIASTGDFNGDGYTDLLLRRDDGWVTNWLGTAAGGFTNNGANTALFFTTDWKVIGTGDVNGDGKDDIILRREDGWITDWLATDSGGFTNNGANTALYLTTDWKISSIADFNGDGREDILLRNDSGWMTNWLATATGSFTNNGANFSTFIAPNWVVQDPFM